ncbi:C-type natriuretic peptide 1-like [Polyodon spathula]|uniref:C-type natriuretic peptide 1-like n=1 Tax=Polyodon spathula TaxID=7913 RepID=UPI001B7F3A03|nr:C-type natriuretic peptide 1-like [Polyodon spathula]
MEQSSWRALYLSFLLFSPLAQIHCRALSGPELQLLSLLIEKYSERLTSDDLSEDMLGEHIESDSSRVSESSRVGVKEQQTWTEPLTTNKKAWIHFRGSLANKKWEPVGRLKKGWARGCFGLRLDRIGSISGLGC